MTNLITILPCLIFIIVIFIIGLIISLILSKKGKKEWASYIKIMSIIFLFSVMGIFIYNIMTLNTISKEYKIEISIEDVDTTLNKEIDFILISKEKEEYVHQNDIHKEKSKLRILNIEEGEIYQFTIISQNFKFVSSFKSFSGNISMIENKLKIDNINLESQYYQIILQENKNIQIQTIGEEGNITFRINLDTYSAEA